MKASTTELDALLASKQAILAFVCTITLANGDVLRLTTAPDFNVVWAGQVYNRDYVITVGDVTSSVGVDVDETDITFYVRPDDRIYGLTLPQFTNNKGFDDAHIVIHRAFLSSPDYLVGVVHYFEGQLSEPAPSSTLITMKASSDMVYLNQMVPGNTITPQCSNVLFDDLCQVARNAFTHAGAAQAGSTGIAIASGLSQPDGYFTQGTILFTSGNNEGAKRTIKNHSGSWLTPAYPFYYPVNAGDTFEAVAGCDRLRATCKNKFNNESHIRIFEKVPTPVTSA
jgi:uncharacterized phage protein (TIGR02218 family)